MNYLHICKDESLITEENSVSPQMLFPGNYYIWKYNMLIALFRCISQIENKYVKVYFVVFNGFLTDQSEERLLNLYTKDGNFYKVVNPLSKEIKDRYAVPPPIPSLRMLSYNQLDEYDQVEYSYAANVRGIFPPIQRG
jgi:hypothetical protein